MIACMVIWRCRPLLRRSRGFKIVEVLAALLVMAVGIVGIAALYSDQVQTNPEAQLLARLPRWRSRSRNASARPRKATGFATTVGVLCEQQTKPKLPQDVAAREAACWEDEVERELPSGLGTITRDTLTTPPTYVSQ